jgi:hypothetical protein
VTPDLTLQTPGSSFAAAETPAQLAVREQNDAKDAANPDTAATQSDSASEWVAADAIILAICLIVASTVVSKSALAVRPLNGARIVSVLTCSCRSRRNLDLGTLLIGAYIEVLHRTWEQILIPSTTSRWLGA